MASGATELLRDLESLTSPAQVSALAADRVAYARDLWPRQQLVARSENAAPCPPAAVVWPADVTEVQALVRYAREQGVPLVPYGAGSGVCGGIRPSTDAIVMDVKRMRALERVDADLLLAHAGAGILGQHLEDALAQRGFTLGHFPSSIACSTLGGWIAARSAGQCSGRYGKIEDMLTRVRFVDGTGDVHEGAVGTSSEWLIPLITGSEGTLGVITDASLRISPAPAERVFWSATFDSTERGLQAIRELYQRGLRPAVARLYDAFDTFIGGKAKDKDEPPGGRAKKRPPPGETRPGLGVRALVSAIAQPGALNALVHAIPESMLAGALLVLMWEDDGAIAAAELAEAKRIAGRFGAKDAGEAPARRWFKHRHSVSYRQSPIFAGGGFADTMEIAAPWSRLWEVHEAVRAAVKPHAFVMAHFSHAYPDGGSIYFTFAGGGGTEAEVLARYDATWKVALTATLSAGGILSHHHGVGFSKAAFMREDQGLAVELTRAAKRVLDPAGILNPGALLPPEENARTSAPPAAAAAADATREPGRTPRIDHTSMTVLAGASETLQKLETLLRPEGLTLGTTAMAPTTRVADWARGGFAGGRDTESDPVDQFASGLAFSLGGRTVRIRPAPRRAAGPDWIRVFALTGGAFGELDDAWLTASRVTEHAERAFLFADESQARAAHAWMRGRGVRPLRSLTLRRAEGVVLGAVFDGEPAVREAHVSVFESVCLPRGGVPVGIELLHPPPPASTNAAPALAEAIAREFCARAR